MNAASITLAILATLIIPMVVRGVLMIPVLNVVQLRHYVMVLKTHNAAQQNMTDKSVIGKERAIGANRIMRVT